MDTNKLKRADFLLLKQKGKKLKSRYFIFLYLPSTDPGMGFIVSKKHGGAVARNKQKRWIRALYKKENEGVLEAHFFKLLIIALPSGALFEQKKEDLSFSLNKIRHSFKGSLSYV